MKIAIIYFFIGFIICSFAFKKWYLKESRTDMDELMFLIACIFWPILVTAVLFIFVFDKWLSYLGGKSD